MNHSAVAMGWTSDPRVVGLNPTGVPVWSFVNSSIWGGCKFLDSLFVTPISAGVLGTTECTRL